MAMRSKKETNTSRFLNFIKNALAFGGLGIFCLSMYQLAWGTASSSITEESLASLPSLETGAEERIVDDGGLVIVLDPGHGGKDPGTLRGEVIEKDLNMDITRRVRKRLEKRGMRVVMTRSGDHEISLNDRAAIGNRYKNALFVSVHHNATTSSPLAQGVETFFSWPKPASVLRRQCEIYGLGAESGHEDERSRMLAERV
jgi:N-acetylmuramoyl-L-alanine amidase